MCSKREAMSASEYSVVGFGATHNNTFPCAALSSEQKALLDFLVLARGQRLVGISSSTFSYFLREYRTLGGLPRSASVLADASAIGTNPMFVSAGTIA